MSLLNVKQIKKLAKENNKRVGKDFLHALECDVNNHIIRACKTHNGGKKTLDGTLAAFLKIGLEG